eukprot:272174_1
MAAVSKSNNDTQETTPLVTKQINPSLTIADGETNTKQNEEQYQTGTKSEDIETFEETKHETDDIKLEMTRKACDGGESPQIVAKDDGDPIHKPCTCCCIPFSCECCALKTRLALFHKHESDSTMMLLDLNVKDTESHDLLSMLDLEMTGNDDYFIREIKQKVMQIRTPGENGQMPQIDEKEFESTFKEEIKGKLNQMREKDVAGMVGLIMRAMKKMTSREDETWTRDDDQDVLQLWISKKMRETQLKDEIIAKVMVWFRNPEFRMANKMINIQKPMQNEEDNCCAETRKIESVVVSKDPLLSKIEAVTNPKEEEDRNCCVRACVGTKEINKYGDSVPRKLTEDIWALAYCVVKNREVLPCSLFTTISCIYVVQVISLGLLIWSYSTELNKDVIVQYSSVRAADCSWGESWATGSMFIQNAHLHCQEMSMVEADASTQTYESLEGKRLYINEELQDVSVFQEHSWLFACLSFSSWVLLTTYILSSLANPFAFIAIGNHDYWNPTSCFCCVCNCSCRCSSIPCLLYGMAAANIILAVAAYYTGFVILYTYPLYFGIESPADIVLAPIGLVFILEIDNWAYEVVKMYYAEAAMDELLEWSFSGVTRTLRRLWGCLLGVLTFIGFAGCVYYVVSFKSNFSVIIGVSFANLMLITGVVFVIGTFIWLNVCIVWSINWCCSYCTCAGCRKNKECCSVDAFNSLEVVYDHEL